MNRSDWLHTEEWRLAFDTAEPPARGIVFGAFCDHLRTAHHITHIPNGQLVGTLLDMHDGLHSEATGSDMEIQAQWSYSQTERWLAISARYSVEVARSVAVTPLHGARIETPFILTVFKNGRKLHESKHATIDDAQDAAGQFVSNADAMARDRLRRGEDIREVEL